MYSATHSYAYSYREVESLWGYFSLLTHNQLLRFANSNQWAGKREGEKVKGNMREKIGAKYNTAWKGKAFLLTHR